MQEHDHTYIFPGQSRIIYPRNPGSLSPGSRMSSRIISRMISVLQAWYFSDTQQGFSVIFIIELTGNAGCSGITYMGTFSQMSSLKISLSRKKCMYFWRNYMYFRQSCSLTKRYKCSRMYTGRVSPIHNWEHGQTLPGQTYKYMYFSRIPIRGLGQVPGITHPRKPWCSEESLSLYT